MTPNEHEPLLIACAILREEIFALQDKGRIRAATHFLSSRLHSDPQRLKKALTAAMAFFRRKYGRRISDLTGLPLRERPAVGLDGLEKVINEAIRRLPEP